MADFAETRLSWTGKQSLKAILSLLIPPRVVTVPGCAGGPGAVNPLPPVHGIREFRRLT